MSDFTLYSEWLENLNWLKKGDCIYVVSDMLDLAKAYREHGVRLDMNEVIDGLQKFVGEEGTLLFPTFNWDFCKGVGFDYQKTPVRTGALSKAALKRSDFARTAHPLYSFAVWGAGKKELLAIDAVDSFGEGTIFEKIGQWKGKILAIGLSALRGASYIHHVEQIVGVPYRYHKEFTADYTDAAGICSRKTYRMYVRDLEMNPCYINGFQLLEEQMRSQGQIMTEYYEGTVQTNFFEVADLEQAVRKDILENDSRKMYTYNHLEGRGNA